ncbi:MAG TPA: polyprenyl synthetase family protein [Candidatus Woesebacteria bacterium]|nr:polyprenyl synthetase family protein [Candidatus Woesebacteria bacterium]
MQNIKTLLQQHKKDINTRISTHISQSQYIFGSIGTTTNEALDRLETFTIGGKGIRGGLFILSAEMFGYKQREVVLDIAASLELLQSSLLIHDDIMDNDFVRRGNPSVFAQYIENGKHIGTADSLSYGKSMGICIGDIGFFMAMDIASKALHNHINRDKLVNKLHKELIIVGLAQMDDVTFAASQKTPEINEIINMYRYKTAHYTFSLPLTLGGIIADQTSDTISQLEKLGEYIGLLFQIKDDELSVYGKEKLTGKPIGSDLRENKKTVLRALLEKNLSHAEKNQFEKISQKNITDSDIQYYLALLEQYQIREKIKNIMQQYESEATDNITNLQITQEHKQILLALLEYVTDRTA